MGPRGIRASRKGFAFALLATLALALAGTASAPAPVSAAIAGQQEAWGEFGTAPGQFFDPTFMGVDPSDGSVYVASYPGDFSVTRIQKFSAAGTLEGTAMAPGFSETNGLIGIAVDHAKERFYVLEDEVGRDSRRSDAYVASKILAFKATPNASHELEQVASLPVPPAGEEQTLFEPQEIAVDPSNHDVVVLGEDSAGKAVLQRIGTSGGGSIGARFVDTGSLIAAGQRGIAIGPDGVTYVVALPTVGHQARAYTVPPEFSPATLTPLAGFEAATANESWPSEDLLVEIPEFGTNWGPQVALGTAGNGERTLYWKSFVPPARGGNEAGNYVVHGYSLEDEATSAAFGAGTGEAACRIQSRRAALAAGPDDSLVVLDQGEEVAEESQEPSWFPAVLRFGPGSALGSHSASCPAPAAAIELEEEGGGEIASGGSVGAGALVTLDGSGSELNGKTLTEMTWKIEGGSGGPVTVQGEKVSHLFSEPGTYTIRLNMKTSNFVGIGTNFAATPKQLVVTAAAKPTLGIDLTGTGEVKCKVGTGPEETCAAEYDKGTELTLVPKPGAHFAFSGWSGGTGSAASCAGTGSCSFTLEADSTVGAPFAAIKRTLTISSGVGSGSGHVKCEVNGGPTVDDPCAAEYVDGTQLKLTPVATSGSDFVEFKNGTGPAASCTGANPCTITLEGGNAALDARFDLIPGQVQFQEHLNGAGEIKCNGGACAPTYAEGTVVTVAAVPAAHSRFGGWTVTGSGSVTTPCTGATSPCEVKMQAPGPVAVTAAFSPIKHTLGIDLTGTGEVRCKVGAGPEETCAPEYDEGTELTLVPKPGAHFAFSGWSGGTGSAASCAGTGSCSFTLEADSTVGAPFAAIKRTLTIDPAGTGSGAVTCDGGGCAANYPDGTSITLAASPASGSTFSGWSGGTGSAAACTGTGSCTFTLGANSTVTATFGTIPAGSGGGGKAPSGGSGSSGGTGTTGTTPGGGRTPVQKLAEKRAKARAKCKKLHGKAKASCMKRANQIGKPKKKPSAQRPLMLVGWAALFAL